LELEELRGLRSKKMTGIRRQKKKYSRPRKPFDIERIKEENEVVKKYGLKNKREIWKADAAISRLRNIAKGLITASQEEQKAFLERLVAKGFLVVGEEIDDVLDLKKENYLERRLQTILFKKKFAKTLKHARQLVTHRFVIVKDRIVNVPSYIVNLKEEQTVKVLPPKPKSVPKPIMEAPPQNAVPKQE